MKPLLPYFSIIVLSVVIVACSNGSQNSSMSKNNGKDSIAKVDTTYYQSHKIYELISMKGANKEGKYLSYTENDDTLLSGQYQNGLRNGIWTQKNYSDKLKESNNPLYGLKYFGVGTNKLYFIPNIVRIFYEFSQDSIKTIHEYSWRKSNPAQLMSHTVIVYGVDTTVTVNSWYPNGVHSGVNRSLNGGLSNDTSWSWREDGTLDYMLVYKRGKLIVSRDYDKTGTKVIKEKKGE